MPLGSPESNKALVSSLAMISASHPYEDFQESVVKIANLVLETGPPSTWAGDCVDWPQFAVGEGWLPGMGVNQGEKHEIAYDIALP